MLIDFSQGLVFIRALGISLSSLFLSLQELGRDSDRSLTQKQCQILDRGLEDLKEFFHASGQGLKKNYLEKTSELISLKYALSLYTQTTDSLIKTFVKTEKDQDRPALEESFGEVSIQVDLFTHPGSGEHKVTVKGTSAMVLYASPSLVHFSGRCQRIEMANDRNVSSVCRTGNVWSSSK